jgi:hypothetical protein
MKTTAQYLDELREKTGTKSDGAAGLALGWTRPATSNYRHLRTAFDNHTCLRVAIKLNLPIIQVIADMELQRTTDAARRKDWLPFATPDPPPDRTPENDGEECRCHFDSDTDEKNAAKSLACQHNN